MKRVLLAGFLFSVVGCGTTGDSHQAEASSAESALRGLIGSGSDATNSEEKFDCVQDRSGIICTSEELDLVVWCDYESDTCGGGCLNCN